MGVVSALVYLLTVIVFIPFPFYKDIVAAASHGDHIYELDLAESQDVISVVEGRVLHRFPHSKVSGLS